MSIDRPGRGRAGPDAVNEVHELSNVAGDAVNESCSISDGVPANLLTRSQREALSRLCAATYQRGRRGWQAPGQPTIGLSTGVALRAAGVAEVKTSPGHPRLVPTDLGRRIAGFVRDQRARAKETGR